MIFVFIVLPSVAWPRLFLLDFVVVSWYLLHSSSDHELVIAVFRGLLWERAGWPVHSEADVFVFLRGSVVTTVASRSRKWPVPVRSAGWIQQQQQQQLRLSSFSYDYWRDLYPLMVLGVIRQHSSSVLLTIPFRLCNLRDCHLLLFLLVTVGVGWSSRFSSARLLYPWTNSFVWSLVSTVGGVAGLSSFGRWL